jgi:hypothetical protein
MEGKLALDARSPALGKILARALLGARRLVLPLVVALPPLVWVIEATRRASLETLGRDQGIFQYIAWAVGHGAKDYRDIRDVNGPLTHLVHMVLLALGGADEHTFRTLDLAITGLSFAAVGACLPGLSRAVGHRPPAILERVGWAFAAWVVLSAQYLRYLFWDLAQRESFFDWFMLVSVGLQLAASSPLGRPRLRTPLIALAGALSFIPWFGKPTYVFFTLAQLLTILLSGAPRRELRRDLATFGLGGALGSMTQVLYLLVFADLGAFVRIYFVDVPRLYRFIWPRLPIESVSPAGLSTISSLGLVTSVVMVGLIIDGQLPRRLLAIALVPVAGLGSVIVQAKGFPYHFHPVSAGLYLQGLVLVLWLSEQLGRPRASVDGAVRGLLRVVPFFAAAALSLAVVTGLLVSPHLENLWILQKGITAELRQTRDYLVYFRTGDFFPWEMRQTADYLRAHTKPEDKVQVYGMDPYLLFLAQRLSATPYIYAYDLDVDTALTGSSLPEGLHPTWQQAERIRELRDDHERDFLRRLEAEPPSAFVFMDRSPLMTEDEDAWKDFAEHSPVSALWVAEHYRPTATFGDDRVWMRRDLADGLASDTGVKEEPGAPTR